MRTFSSATRPRTQSGVGMIEVLVAVVVLSFGFLAAANLQIQGMRANMDAKQRSQALLLATDMMDRMQNNPAGVAAGAYSNKTTGTSVAPTCMSTGCNSTQLAALDLYEWSANLISLRGESNFIPLLPGTSDTAPATGTISTPTLGVYTISLNWLGFENGQSKAQTLAVNFRP